MVTGATLGTDQASLCLGKGEFPGHEFVGKGEFPGHEFLGTSWLGKGELAGLRAGKRALPKLGRGGADDS